MEIWNLVALWKKHRSDGKVNYFYQFLSLTLIFRRAKIEEFVKREPEKNFGKKKIKNMLPTKVCMLYELSETILLFGLRYLHLDLFQFLHRYLSPHVQFFSYLFQGKIIPQFWKTGLPLHSQQTRCLVLSFRFLKVVYSDYSMNIWQWLFSINSYTDDIIYRILFSPVSKATKSR